MTYTSIAAIYAEVSETPLHNPFVTSQGRATTARAVAIDLVLNDGSAFRGESVPVKYVTGESVEDVLSTVDAVAPKLVGLDVTRLRAVADVIGLATPDAPSARCGLEMALLAAWSGITGVTTHRLFGGAVDFVESDITIPIVPNAVELAELAWDLGIKVFKMKVGDSPDTDFDRVAAVLHAIPEAHLRIDANQGFSPQAALDFLQRVLDHGAHVQMLEQPVRRCDFEGLCFVAERAAVPVFADESCLTTADALRIAASPVQGCNLKINKNGIWGVLDIISIARAAGKRLMLGCMLETRRSIAVSLAIACGTGAFDFIDLDSHLLLNETGENPFFQQHGAQLVLGF
jgi:L-alanine-DL-glutamate epimerase-like enolase superfamily enzyme